MIAALPERVAVRAATRESPEARCAEGRDPDILALDLAQAAEAPNERWSLDELTARVIAERTRIEAGEQLVTVPHWYLGQALNEARKHFKKGDWGQYLKRCEVTEDVARAARALAKAYKTPNGLENLSVRAALRLAAKSAPNPTTASLLRNLDARLKKAVKAAARIANQLETSADRAALARSLEQTVAALAALTATVGPGEPL